MALVLAVSGSVSELRAQGLISLPSEKTRRSGKVLDKSGKVVFEVEDFEKIADFSEGLARFITKQGGRYCWGYYDVNGRIALRPIYSYASDFQNGRALVGIYTGKYFAIIDRQGKLIRKLPSNLVPCDHFGIDQRQLGGFFCVSQRSGVKKKAGLFGSTGLSLGLLNGEGQLVVPCRYDNFGEASEGLIPVELSRKLGFVDYNGKVVVEPKYRYVSRFKNGLARVLSFESEPDLGAESGYGLIDTSGKIVVPLEYKQIGLLSEGLIAFRKNEKLGYMNRELKIVIPEIFDKAGDFSEGLAPVEFEGGYGFIDRAGQIKVKPRFVMVNSYEGRSALAAIDKREKKVPPAASMDDFYTALRRVDKLKPYTAEYYIKPEFKYGLIDSSGQLLCETGFDEISAPSDGMRVVKSGSKYGYISCGGKLLIESKYPSARAFSCGRAIVADKPKYWYAKKSEEKFDPVVGILGESGTCDVVIDPELLLANLKISSSIVSRFPDSANAYANRAVFLNGLKRFNRALADLEKAVSLNPNSAELIEARAYCYLKMDKPEKAQRAVEDLRENPKLVQGAIVSPGAVVSFLWNSAIAEQNKVRDKTLMSHPLSWKNGMVTLPICCTPEYFGQMNPGVENLAEAFEAAGELDIAEQLICPQSFTLVPFAINYPLDRSEIERRYEEMDLKLQSASRSSKPIADFSLFAKRKACLAALGDLIELRKHRYEVDNLEALLEKRVRLIEKAAEYRRISSRKRKNSILRSSFGVPGDFDVNSAKLDLANFWAEFDDYRCEPIFEELLINRFSRNLSSGSYAFYLARKGRVKRAKEVYSALSDLPEGQLVAARMIGGNTERERVQDLIRANSARLDKAQALRRKQQQFWTPDQGDKSYLSLPPAPIRLNENRPAKLFELARRCEDLSLVNASLYYLKLAENSLKNDTSLSDMKTMIERFRRTHLPIKPISLEVNARYCSNSAMVIPIRVYCLDESKSQLNKCIEEEPTFTQPYAKLMQIAITEGDYEEAGRVFDRVMKVNPDCLGAWVEAGRMFRYSGNNAKAREAFLKVQELDPGNQLARRMLSILRPVH